MHSLTTIPQELRDKIIEVVLLSPSNPALEITDDVFKWEFDSRDTHGQNLNVTSWTRSTGIAYQAWSTRAFVTTSAPLLLLNRRFHAETTACLQRLRPAQKHAYDLDVVLVNEVRLLPTWTRVPALAARVDCVRATFRIAGSAAAPTFEGHYEGFRGGDGGGPALAWVVYGLLERFLRVGPALGPRADVREDRNLSIRRLVIDVETPPGVDTARFGPAVTSSIRRPKNTNWAEHLLDPQYLFEFVVDQMRMLLAMSYHSAGYGGLLYEHVGEIVITKDGADEGCFRADLTAVLARLTYNESFSRDPVRFDNWYRRTRERRAELGWATETQGALASDQAASAAE